MDWQTALSELLQSLKKLVDEVTETVKQEKKFKELTRPKGR